MESDILIMLLYISLKGEIKKKIKQRIGKERKRKGKRKQGKRKEGKIYSALFFYSPGYNLVIISVSPVLFGQLLLTRKAEISAIL